MSGIVDEHTEELAALARRYGVARLELFGSAATGEFERGYVMVADMVTRQPWDDTVPVHVTWSSSVSP